MVICVLYYSGRSYSDLPNSFRLLNSYWTRFSSRVEFISFLNKSVYIDIYDVFLYIKESQTELKNLMHTSN